MKKFFAENSNTDKGLLVHLAEQRPGEEVEFDNPETVHSPAGSSQEIHAAEVVQKHVE